MMMMHIRRTVSGRSRSALVALAAAVLVFAGPARAVAQSLTLTLDDAIRLSRDKSEALAIARSAEARADADTMRARSQGLPQVGLGVSYERTLASEFSGALGTSGAACAPFGINANQPLADRVGELERAASCGALGSTFDFSNLPFGQQNAYRFMFSISQNLYSGGRIRAQVAQARSSRRAAEIETSAADALLTLDVTQAFYDAALSDRLLAIAESGLAQATAAFEQARLAFEAGRQPEFERLRAEVTRDNQRPAVIRRKADRDVAYLRLRQLLELPETEAITLVVDLDAPELAPPLPSLDVPAAPEERASVRQASVMVTATQASLAAARAERLPTLSLSSNYMKVGYPLDGSFPQVDDFRTNWSAGAVLHVPIFTGQRVKAGVRAAQADLAAAEARLKQTREFAELDIASARQDVTAAEAVWQASASTVQQARRAYEIAELRYREGLSTQLELSDSRLSLQIAEANRAQAARDLQVARARVTLLPLLPVGAR